MNSDIVFCNWVLSGFCCNYTPGYPTLFQILKLPHESLKSSVYFEPAGSCPKQTCVYVLRTIDLTVSGSELSGTDRFKICSRISARKYLPFSNTFSLSMNANKQSARDWNYETV